MSDVIGRRRYLTNFDTHRVPHLFTDAIVVGAGVAGLRAALALAERADVLLICKGPLDLSATAWAQGGVAAAIDPEDSVEAHAEDTLATGCGLCESEAVRAVVSGGPACIEELRAMGAAFDEVDGRIALGCEGAHGANRIIHAHGDATGREIARVLSERAAGHPRIRIFEHCFVIDVITAERAARGVVSFHEKHGHQMFWASVIVLATGGAGRVYRESTNPPIATGDGLAAALRCGARLRDVEMIQFHPTTLYVAGAARALISEAVRGEGGRLVNRDGERFMSRYDERGELASRDVVSRAISNEMERTRTANVYLDVRHFAPGRFATRFPTIDALCREFDVIPERDLIPVRPSAHYTVGGVHADLNGRTAVEGLFACGETAAIGLHGANRLASNSLLEGLVMGPRVAAAALERIRTHPAPDHPPNVAHHLPASPRTQLDLDDVRHSLQSVMSRNVGIYRTGDRLAETVEIIDFWARYVMDKVFDEPQAWETQNMLTLARCIVTAAAMRCESRGVHYRADYPNTDEAWRLHIDVTRQEGAISLATHPVGGSGGAIPIPIKT